MWCSGADYSGGGRCVIARRARQRPADRVTCGVGDQLHRPVAVKQSRIQPCDWLAPCGWLVCLYELALGVETTAAGNAIAAERREIPDLFVVGTLRKPSFWESTTVPELREQAATVAERVYRHGLRRQAPISTREEPSIRHPAAARYERQSATSSAFPVYRRPDQLPKVLQSRVLQHRISILWTMSTGGT